MTEEQILALIKERIRQWDFVIDSNVGRKDFATLHKRALEGIIIAIENGNTAESEREDFEKAVDLMKTVFEKI